MGKQKHTSRDQNITETLGWTILTWTSKTPHRTPQNCGVPSFAPLACVSEKCKYTFAVSLCFKDMRELCKSSVNQISHCHFMLGHSGTGPHPEYELVLNIIK